MLNHVTRMEPMRPTTDDLRIRGVHEPSPPADLIREFPCTADEARAAYERAAWSFASRNGNILHSRVFLSRSRTGRSRFQWIPTDGQPIGLDDHRSRTHAAGRWPDPAEADHYGLADLHQLRGRVGRSAWARSRAATSPRWATSCIAGSLRRPCEAWLPQATAERQVDDLAAELADPNKLLASIRSLVDLG